ncbi:MAG: replication-associated recombination protein A [Deltaproteobacteria bacterium]|nr:replication-associated recombination protein A [Deltaproteobacteria bacterium]
MAAPLADRLRPRTLDEIRGQDHLLAPGAPFRRAVEAGRLRSVLLWGPPGCGKTTLARCLAEAAGYRMVALSAVLAGVKELKEVIEQRPAMDTRPLMLFVDEIHRWNKAQQDALLPHVESGALTLVGATTENPAFQLVPALRSRCELLVLRPVEPAAVRELLDRACTREGILADADALDAIAAGCDGDARRALSMLERLHDRGEVSLAAMRALGNAIFHDRDGDAHYDVVSAFIKSMRGSDPDAALYWMARMLEGGEDPMFVARRMVIFASEDVGNAEPRGLTVATACMEAVARIGMPEARIILGQACTFLATAPKSNASYKAIDAAIAEVRRSGARPVPAHLRNAPTALAKSLGHGEGYRYPHDFPDHFVEQDYLPEGVEGGFYRPAGLGNEKTINERMAWWKRRSSERKPR